jgi:hypothetical protein
MATLAARCKACGAQVFSGVRTGWVQRPVLGARVLACRACGIQATYHGADFAPAQGSEAGA